LWGAGTRPRIATRGGASHSRHQIAAHANPESAYVPDIGVNLAYDILPLAQRDQRHRFELDNVLQTAIGAWLPPVIDAEGGGDKH
jgi:hypothetical protein